MIKIEKGIAMPEARTRGVTPFDDMEIGDSFLWSQTYFNVPTSLRKKGWKFSARSVRNEASDVTHTRVWRIA